MRINIHSSGGKPNQPSNNMVNTLLKLLAEQDVLRGIVRRFTPSSVFVFLQNEEVEVELPLQGRSLAPGQLVELTQEGASVALKRLPHQPSVEVSAGQPGLNSKQIEQVLVELNIPPTEEAVLVAQGLMERGFPLQEPLVWSLLPWAEEGQLEEAFLVLQAKFPLKPELLAMVTQLKARPLGDAILAGARDSLPPDLQEILERPSLESRARWNNRFSEGETFKALARLLVEERFVESLLGRQSNPNQLEYVLALPFLRKDDLHAAWVRITRDEDSLKEEGDERGSFWLELEIPTSTLGLVWAELLVRGNTVAVTLKVGEHLERAEEALEELEQELGASGWNPRELTVRGWDNAQGSGITL
ncbi:MAG TPA: hypothetical protein DDZ66_09740 [Firmicutes bacterium]|jgi:hypothetical protein|nr:hypothetical protein [Bacillota bacterium]